MKSLSMRPASTADAERIAELSGQLGYAATPGETARRLGEILARAEHAIFVADDGTTLLGWVHVFVSHSLLAETPAEISGLVVDETHRGRGIGRLLMERAEQWAQNKGCNSLRLRSNVLRSAAHAFYERLGYQTTKTQLAFRKVLTA